MLLIESASEPISCHNRLVQLVFPCRWLLSSIKKHNCVFLVHTTLTFQTHFTVVLALSKGNTVSEQISRTVSRDFKLEFSVIAVTE